MTTWKTLSFILCIAGLPLLAADEPASFPEGYWDRPYPMGQQWSVYYNINLKVKDRQKVQDQIQRILTGAGGVQTNSYGGFPGGFPGRPNIQAPVMMAFSMPASSADKAVKRLFDVGELQQFNSHKTVNPDMLKEITEKISKLQAEMASNAGALEKMPVAKALMTSTLSRLKAARDYYQKSADKAMINVTLYGETDSQ